MHGLVFCRIQHSGENLVLDLDQLHCLQGSLFGFRGNDGNRITGETNMAVNDQTVIGRRLREGLTGNGKTGLGHIFPGVNVYNTGHLLSGCGIDGFHHGVGMGRTEDLDHQSILGGHIVRIDRLTQQKLHGVLLADGFVDGLTMIQ